MALTDIQHDILAALAERRKTEGGGSGYVAGGVALNVLLARPRRSRDIDLFHDHREAVRASYMTDRATLVSKGFCVEPLHEAETFVEARVSRADSRTDMQWALDSAFRFFPLIEHPVLGLALHPFDLATNKVLAMAGRLEPRDWIDLIASAEEIQPLGLLVWAACGKDPGYSPTSLLAAISRHRYPRVELDALDFPPDARPDAAALSRHWHRMTAEAAAFCTAFPPEQAGHCVVTSDGALFVGTPADAARAFAGKRIGFHPGALYGAWPRLVGYT